MHFSCFILHVLTQKCWYLCLSGTLLQSPKRVFSNCHRSVENTGTSPLCHRTPEVKLRNVFVVVVVFLPGSVLWNFLFVFTWENSTQFGFATFNFPGLKPDSREMRIEQRQIHTREHQQEGLRGWLKTLPMFILCHELSPLPPSLNLLAGVIFTSESFWCSIQIIQGPLPQSFLFNLNLFSSWDSKLRGLTANPQQVRFVSVKAERSG